MQNKNKFVKLGAGLTAIALSLTLTSGCDYKKKDKFYFHPNIQGELVLDKNSYISINYINEYYVIELYNKVLDRTTIYIAHRYKYKNGDSKYTNIFTNNKIAYENNMNDYYNFINVTPLEEYLIEYNLIKDKYSYQDMKNLLEVIKKNYIYNKENSNSKKLIK